MPAASTKNTAAKCQRRSACGCAAAGVAAADGAAAVMFTESPPIWAVDDNSPTSASSLATAPTNDEDQK